MTRKSARALSQTDHSRSVETCPRPFEVGQRARDPHLLKMACNVVVICKSV